MEKGTWPGPSLKARSAVAQARRTALNLPCSLLVRINGEVQVQSDNQGHTPTTPTFTNNCAVRPAAPTYCDITLTSDQTVTATYGG